MNIKFFILLFIGLAINACEYNFHKPTGIKPLTSFIMLSKISKKKLKERSIDELKKINYGFSNESSNGNCLTNTTFSDQSPILRLLFLQFNLYQFPNFRRLLNSYACSPQLYSEISRSLLQYPLFHLNLKKVQGFEGHQLCHFFHCKGSLENSYKLPAHIMDELKRFVSDPNIYSQADECLFFAIMIHGSKVKTPVSRCIATLFEKKPFLFLYQKYLENWEYHAKSNDANEKLTFNYVNNFGLRALWYLSHTKDSVKEELKHMLEKSINIENFKHRSIIFLAMDLYTKSINCESPEYIKKSLKDICNLLLDCYNSTGTSRDISIIKLAQLWTSLASSVVPSIIMQFFNNYNTLSEAFAVFLTDHIDDLSELQQDLIKLFVLFLNNCSKSDMAAFNVFFHDLDEGLKTIITAHLRSKSIISYIYSFLRSSNEDAANDIKNYLVKKVPTLPGQQHSDEAFKVFTLIGEYYAESLKIMKK